MRTYVRAARRSPGAPPDRDQARKPRGRLWSRLRDVLRRAAGRLSSLSASWARAGDPRFEAASCRWLTRLASEKGKTLAHLQLGSAAMGVLAVDPDSEQAWESLTALVSS